MNSNLQCSPVSRPGEPTDAAPGSRRKIRVLMERAARREALFHPKDNPRRRPPGIEDVFEDNMEVETVIDTVVEEDIEEEVEYDIDLAG